MEHRGGRYREDIDCPRKRMPQSTKQRGSRPLSTSSFDDGGADCTAGQRNGRGVHGAAGRGRDGLPSVLAQLDSMMQRNTPSKSPQTDGRTDNRLTDFQTALCGLFTALERIQFWWRRGRGSARRLVEHARCACVACVSTCVPVKSRVTARRTRP